MTQAICDITTDEVNVDVVVEPQANTMVEVANRAGGMEQVFHDNTLIGNGNSVDLGVNTDIIATKEYSDEQDTLLRNEINGKLTAIDSQIDANADAIQKTREDYINADSEIHQILNNHASELTTLRGNQASLGDQVAGIEEKIPESASGSNPLITKQQLLDEEMDIRDDLNEGLSELQTQITAQAAEIATKQDQLIAGDNIIISGNVISATGAGGGVGFDVTVVQELPESGKKGIIYLVPKDGSAPDIYDEYVWVTTTSTFELIGSTKVDLTGYAKKEDLDGYLPLSGGTLTGTLLLAKTGRYALESMGEMKITNSETGAFTYLNGGNIQVGPAKIIGAGTSTSNPTLQIGLGTINSYYQFTTTGFFATRTESKILGSKTSPWEVVYAKTISVGGSGYDITVPQKTGTIALAEDIEQAVNTQNLTVGSGEGSLYMGVVAGTATIATNNGLDIAAQTKFDTAPTTDDSTTYANALGVSLMRKAQVEEAISDAIANIDALPDQTGNAGKVLTTDGSEASWTDMPGLIIRRL